MKRGFSLVEMLIVVAILGILAAIVLPQFQSHSQEAREVAAKDNLRILRQQIELYAAQHDGVPPGYPNDDLSATPSYMAFGRQMTELEHRLSQMPENPFNNLALINVLGDNEDFPPAPVDTDLYGWIYKPATKTIKLNWLGTDSAGVAYFEY